MNSHMCSSLEEMSYSLDVPIHHSKRNHGKGNIHVYQSEECPLSCTLQSIPIPLKLTIQPFHNRCATNVNTARGLFSHFRVDNYFQDGTRCKWVSWNVSRPTEEIFDWPTDYSSLKYENNILQLHKRKPCSKVVIWGVKLMATLCQCPYVNSEITCGMHEIKTCKAISQNAACAKWTIAFEPNEGARIVKQLYCYMKVMSQWCQHEEMLRKSPSHKSPVRQCLWNGVSCGYLMAVMGSTWLLRAFSQKSPCVAFCGRLYMKSLIAKVAKFIFMTSEKNVFLCASLYTRLWKTQYWIYNIFFLLVTFGSEMRFKGKG